MISVTANRDLLVKKHPRLFHMTHAGSWPGILRHGLLSTSALLDLFEIPEERRILLESNRRAESEEIRHPLHGRALLRDQKPLNVKKLAVALEGGLQPGDWFRLLNGKVFFWSSCERLQRIRQAKEYRADRQTFLVIDTARLVDRHADRISLSHINSGATNPFAAPRGLDTFVPIEKYPWMKRGRAHEVAEVTVESMVPDIAGLVVEVYEEGGGRLREDLFVS